MKIPIHQASDRLKMHPLNLILRLQTMTGSLEDCWPSVDDGYIETLIAMFSDHHQNSPRLSIKEGIQPNDGVYQKPEVSKSAAQILDKLERQDRWGSNAISWDTLRNHFCRTVPGVEDAVNELVRAQFILGGEGRIGPFSLNPSKKRHIITIVSQLRSQSKPDPT